VVTTTRKERQMSRLLLTTVGVALAAASIVPASAGAALPNGALCGPQYTQASAPTAAFALSPPSSLTQSAVSFDGSSSSSGTADVWTFISGDNACEQTSTINDPIVTYKWNFGDGAVETDTTATTSHTYAHAGQYTVGLTVTERFCQAGPHAHCFSASTTQTATIVDRPPVAAFTQSASVTTGANANFDASASSDPDGTIANYHWDFGDGETLNTTTPVAAHIYSTPGSKTVTLTVTDDSGSTDTVTHTLTVADRPPTASFTAPATVAAGQAAAFDASASNDPDGTIVTYHWDFGDGQSQDSSSPTVTHTYSSPGSKTVTLTVTDNSGSTATAQHTVTVTEASVTCAAPNLIGRNLAKARTLLISHHCSLGAVHRNHRGHGKRGRVIKQSVTPGSELPNGSEIAVTIKK
jgi:PKD repeat protein